jgi:hypothetical protein
MQTDVGVEKYRRTSVSRFIKLFTVVRFCALADASGSSRVSYLLFYSVFALGLKETQYREYLENYAVFITFCKRLCIYYFKGQECSLNFIVAMYFIVSAPVASRTSHAADVS